MANSPCVIALFSWQTLQAAVKFILSTHENTGALGGQVTRWEVAGLGHQPELIDQGLALSLAVGGMSFRGSLILAAEGLCIIRRALGSHWRF